MASVIQAGTASNTALTLSSDTSGELQLKTNSGSTTAMTLTTAGNVGIGTTSPAQTLHVVGRGIVDNGTGTQNGFSVGTTSSSTGTNFGTIDINGTSYSGLYLRVGNTNNGVFWANQGVQVELGSLTSIPLLLKTNDTERMRITSAGLVGIGENSPTHRLQVAGNSGAEVKITRGTNDCVISLSNNIGGAVFIGSTVASPLVLQTSNTERIRIDTSGNVGIGTSGPTCRFDVTDSVSTRLINFNSTGANGPGIGLSNSGTDFAYFGSNKWALNGNLTDYGQVAVNNFIFGAGNTERMRITSDGQLLLGSTTSTALANPQVQVGSTSATVAGLQILSSTTGTGGVYYGDSTTGGGRYAGYIEYYHSTNNMVFGVGEVERMRINSDGDVLINTTTKNNDGLISISADSALHQGITIKEISTGNNIYYIYFTNSAGNGAGRIEHTGATTVSYVTSSDARLKTNIVDSDSAKPIIDAIKIREFDWVSGEHQKFGVVAQELIDVAPEAVSVGRTDNDSWGVDYSKLVPHLIKYVQEQQAMIEELKQEVDKLKGV